MTLTLTPGRIRARLVKTGAVVAVSGIILLSALTSAGAARADEILDPAGVTEQVELVEPTEAVESTETADVVEPAEVVEPTEAVEPTDLVELAEVIEPAAEAAEPAAAQAPIPNALDPVAIVANTDFMSGAFGTTADFPLTDLYLNDSDPTAVLYEIDDPAGQISVQGKWLSFAMPIGFSGNKQFQYRTISGLAISNWATVVIQITPTLVAPTASNDVYSIQQGSSLNVTSPGVLANDSYAGSGGVWASSDQTGEAFIFGNGNLLYNPDPAFSGTKTVKYQIHDANGFSNWATVLILVSPSPAGPGTPVASNDTYTTAMNTKLDVSSPGVLVNDTGGQVNSISGFYPGIAALDPTGAFSYEPPVGFSGTVVVNYTIIQNGIVSGLASITVEVTNPTVGLPTDPTDPRDPRGPLDPDPIIPLDPTDGTGSTIPAGTTTGTLAHAGVTSSWIAGPALSLVLVGSLALGFAAARRRATRTV